MKAMLALLLVSGCTVTVVEQQPVVYNAPVYTEYCRWIDDVRYDYYGRLVYHNKYYVCEPL